jgi:stage V sporulation protein S
MEKNNVNTLRVAGNSSVKAVAGSITKSFEDKKEVEILAIGASAVNQAIKACAMARGFMSTKGYDLYLAPGFSTTQIDGEEKTTIRLVLKLL